MFGSIQREALLIGLRGRAAKSRTLVEIGLGGTRVEPLSDGFPICGKVTLIIKKSDPEAIRLGEYFAKSLEHQLREDGMLQAGLVTLQKLSRELRGCASSG